MKPSAVALIIAVVVTVLWAAHRTDNSPQPLSLGDFYIGVSLVCWAIERKKE